MPLAWKQVRENLGIPRIECRNASVHRNSWGAVLRAEVVMEPIDRLPEATGSRNTEAADRENATSTGPDQQRGHQDDQDDQDQQATATADDLYGVLARFRCGLQFGHIVSEANVNLSAQRQALCNYCIDEPATALVLRDLSCNWVAQIADLVAHSQEAPAARVHYGRNTPFVEAGDTQPVANLKPLDGALEFLYSE